MLRCIQRQKEKLFLSIAASSQRCVALSQFFIFYCCQECHVHAYKSLNLAFNQADRLRKIEKKKKT